MAFDTPVALFVFNRPEETRRVFAEIAKLQPRTLLIVADGPRAHRPGEAELCAEVRDIVAAVDWECTVLRNYAEENLGCQHRMVSGIDWVFSECEEAILFEDDCLPDPTFFPFCAELLERYRDDDRVMMISGDDFYAHPAPPAYSYRFSHYNFIWGWASWRRAWQHFDVHLAAWPALRETGWLDDVTHRPAAERYWRSIFDRVHSKEISTVWDFQWIFATWLREGVSVVPNRNLVANIGFGGDATHTRGVNRLTDKPREPMEFPLRHPPVLEPDVVADRFVSDEVLEWGIPTRAQEMYYRTRRRASALLPSSVRRMLRRALGRPVAS